jgi:hypothetical protein
MCFRSNVYEKNGLCSNCNLQFVDNETDGVQFVEIKSVKRKISLVCSGCFLETVVKESELG